MAPEGAAVGLGDRRLAQRVALTLLSVATVLAILVAVGVGPSSLTLSEVIAIIFAGPNSADIPLGESVIVWQIRLPRVLIAALVGGSLAVSGAIMQGLFRNPLADPGLVGVSSGASLGAVAVLSLGQGMLAPFVAVFGMFSIYVAAFIGGIATSALLYVIATRDGLTSVATLLLSGIAIGAFSAALIGLLIYVSDDEQLRNITFWLLGGLGGATWHKVILAGPIMLAGCFAAQILPASLNALALGEAEAFHMGHRVQSIKRIAIFIVALATGAAVAVSGTIGFVGLVVPHVLRLAVGADHRFLIPASVLGGAFLLVVADSLARIIVAPAELPLGILTALFGAPFFLWLLIRRRGLSGV